MKNRTKSILSCLSVALVASIAGGVSVIKTTAEENESTPIFAAAQTAGIRLADGEDDVAGIRWEITMNQDYYTALNVAEGATVQFGAFVAPTKNLEENEVNTLLSETVGMLFSASKEIKAPELYRVVRNGYSLFQKEDILQKAFFRDFQGFFRRGSAASFFLVFPLCLCYTFFIHSTGFDKGGPGRFFLP